MFYNIRKANAEIERLKAELATAAESAKANSDGKEAFEALSKANEELDTKLTQANSDLATAKQTLATTIAAKEKAESDLKAAQAEIAALPQKIKEAASAQAAAIVAQTGAAPISGVPTSKPGEQAKEELKGKARWDASFKVV